MDWEGGSAADAEWGAFVPTCVALGLVLTRSPSELGLGINLQVSYRFSPEIYKVSI